MGNYDSPGQNRDTREQRGLRITIQILLSLVVLGCAVALGSYYLKSSPKAKPKKRTPSPTLVEVVGVGFDSQIYTVHTMGTVIGAKEVNLTPRVSGEIIKISDELVPGGHFAKDADLLTIDPADYELIILQLKSEVAKSQSDLQLEMGNQRIARKEFEILGQDVSDTEETLMLRKPQLGIARANLQSVEARLKQAHLDLSRTRVTAPFNCVVLSRSAELGSRVSPASSLAQLVGTDEFWVKLTIPVEQLQWIDIPASSSETGSEVRVSLQEKSGTSVSRVGKVIRLGAGLEQDGRMAIVYASIADPLCLLPENGDKPRLLLGSFVRAEITGREFTDLAVIPRAHLRENNTVWLLDGDNRLEIREVNITARTRDQIFIESGLTENDHLITSSIASPTAGMLLQPGGDISPRHDESTAPKPAEKSR